MKNDFSSASSSSVLFNFGIKFASEYLKVCFPTLSDLLVTKRILFSPKKPFFSAKKTFFLCWGPNICCGPNICWGPKNYCCSNICWGPKYLLLKKKVLYRHCMFTGWARYIFWQTSPWPFPNHTWFLVFKKT